MTFSLSGSGLGLVQRLERLVRQAVDRLPDWVYPHLQGERPELPLSPTALSAVRSDTAAIALEAYRRRLTEEEERARHVDARMTPLLALSGVIAAAFLAAFPVVLSSRVKDVPLWELLVALLVGFYVIFQAILCVEAAVCGLERRNFQVVSGDDLDPVPDESPDAYQLRLLEAHRPCLTVNDSAVNDKVGHMAVAHAALKNSLRGSLILAMLIGVFALSNNWSTPSSDASDHKPTSTATPQDGARHDGFRIIPVRQSEGLTVDQILGCMDGYSWVSRVERGAPPVIRQLAHSPSVILSSKSPSTANLDPRRRRTSRPAL